MARRSAKTKPTTTAKAPLSPMKGPTNFLDLPAELRLQVYGHLLPDRDLSAMRPDRPLRKNGQACSTAFMASCKQVYDETADILYGKQGEVEATISGWSRVKNTARVSFLNQEVALDGSAEIASFGALRQVKDLCIYISTGALEGSVCDAQDMLFKFLRPLSGVTDHHLRTVSVHVNVNTGRDSIYGILSSNAADRYARIDTMQEFRHIKPGDLSRAHLTAFLIDPLRTLRGVQDGKKKGKFSLSFIGETGNPWREILRTIRGMVQGSDPVADYEAFSRYYDVLRPLLHIARPLIPKLHNSQWSFNNNIRRLAEARIGGKVLSFHSYHTLLTNQISKLIENINLTSSTSADDDEYAAREATHLLIELDKLLPPADLDTSFFGYNESDDKLAEWQAARGERRQKKKADAKRKREEVDGGDNGSRKKRGGGGGGGRMRVF